MYVIRTMYREEHWNAVCLATIPGHWEAWVDGRDTMERTRTGWRVPPLGNGNTEQEAIDNLKALLQREEEQNDSE